MDMVSNMIIKRKKVSELSIMESVMQDDGEPLGYRAKFRTEMTLHDLLVKRVDLSIFPLVDFYQEAAAQFKVGKVVVKFPDRRNSAPTNKRQRTVGVTNTALEPEYTPVDGVWDEASQKWVVDNSPDVFLDFENTGHGKSLHYIKRQVYRNHMLHITLSGSGFPFILNFISYDRVEV